MGISYWNLNSVVNNPMTHVDRNFSGSERMLSYVNNGYALPNDSFNRTRQQRKSTKKQKLSFSERIYKTLKDNCIGIICLLGITNLGLIGMLSKKK